MFTPFLDEELIVQAMRIEASRKINNQHKKIILREIAETIGLRKDVAWREKQAAQYGSWFDKALKKLSLKQQFPTKQDYINSLTKKSI